MIIIRDDDVLVRSRAFSDPFAQFRHVHELIKSAYPHFMHVPTVLINEIQEFPQCIEYIREETKAGFMQPQIHGLNHIDYGALPKQTVIEHMRECKEFFQKNFNIIPTQMATPWGADTPLLREALAEEGLELLGAKGVPTLEGAGGLIDQFRQGTPFNQLNGVIYLLHWWNQGSRLARVCAVAKYGSWHLASQAEPKLFRE